MVIKMKTEDATALWQQMFSVSDRMRDIGSSDYKQLFVNMTFNQLRMIKIVYVLNREYPEGVTLKVLAESLSITPAAASEMVDALVRKGMLSREHNPQDRRAVAISLAPFSRKKFQECEQTFDRLRSVPLSWSRWQNSTISFSASTANRSDARGSP